ncbi:PAP2 superfamily protein [Tritrichomonas foetus]|uniref:PAP2 superfamily protein n=1 Tax=Tritrichomonas foetus TaxID=1144522 RepID=A0A1J4KAU7_9EUKA|nr:PAP2 superfamily protein [Tritrichomonas foetus]|eukprot:OHT08016.1 PAP2 superfamily protein [Tritrichomonas foetus]
MEFPNHLTECNNFWKTLKETWKEWIATACIALGTVAISKTIYPQQRVIFYDNYNIRYPYTGETISTPLVSIFIIIIPFFTLILLATIFPKKINLCYAALGMTQTLCLTLIVTEALKVTVARPRPNYFSYCGYDNITQTCQGKPSHRRDALLSFPSGHSSNSFSSATFLTLLMSFTFRNPEIWWILVKFLPVLSALFVSATRIIDHMHHVSDVVAGAILGIGVACMIFLSQYQRIFMANRLLDGDELPLDPTDEIVVSK